MFKRIGLLFLVNIAVIVTVSIILNILGVAPYMTQAGISYQALAIFCLVWGMAGSFISLMMSKFIAKTMMGVKVIDPSSPYGTYAHILHKVHNMAKAAGLRKMPEVGVYESPEINAFATGPGKNNSLVAVSSGLLARMSEDEIDGVLGHEIAHIANGDMVTMALLQGIINAFVMFFARIAAFALRNFLRGDDDDEGFAPGGGFAYMISVFVFEILFSFLAMFVVAFFSRFREYRADEGGARFAGRDKMVNALRALQRTYDSLAISSDNIKCMKISSKSSFMALLSTHPSLEDRIKALERRG